MKSRKLLMVLLFALIAVSCSRDPQAQAQRYLENGNKFFDKGKYKEASIMYRRALQQNLRFGEAYYRLALANLKLAAYGDAARSLRRAVELQPNNADAATKLADIYMVASTQDATNAAQMQKEARELAQKLLQQNPNSYEGHRLMGQLALLARDPETAVTELAAAYKAKQDSQLAVPYFQALILNKRTDEAMSLANDVISRDKTYAPMYDMLYVQYMREDKRAEAEQLLKKKVAANPTQPTYLMQLMAHYVIAKDVPSEEAVLQEVTDEKRFPEGHMLAGDFFFFRTREYDRARNQYEAGMKAEPKDKEAYQKRLVELLATQGRNPDANLLLNTILTEHPKDPDALAMRAALMLQTGNADQISQATTDLQSLVTKTPDNHLLRYNLARALLAKGEIEQARLQLEAAVKIRPDFLIALELLGRIFLSKNDPARALKEADDALKINPNDLQAHLIRSSALLGVGEKDKAKQELDTISKIAPDNPDARYQLGYLQWEGKDYQAAQKVFNDLYKANPKDIRGLVGVVETYMSENKIKDAEKAMQEAVAREPERRDLKLAYANVLVRDLQYDAAIDIFQKLLASDPKSSDLLFRLAETQRRKGDVNTAVDTFRRASQAAPNDPKPLLQLALLMDGTGRREQAKPIYEQILKLQPDHPIALNNLAFIKAEEGVDLDEALTMAQRARQKLPNAPTIQDTLGWIYIKKNLSDDAVRVFKDLVAQDPKNPAYHYHYGMALLQKGDRVSARRELEAAISDNPSKDDAGKIRQLLTSN